MNSETGQMYFEPEEIREAMLRGEPLEELTREAIDRMLRDARREMTADLPHVPLTRGQLRRRQRMGK